jgi:uncharacterized protein YuzE
MRFTYYTDTDSLYIDLADRPGVDSMEVAPGIVLDLDEAGSLVGIDIDHASQQVDLWGKDQTSVPVQVVTSRPKPA